MIEHDIDIDAADGRARTFIAYPDDAGTYPLVVFAMDAPGKREELHDMARRLAEGGYFVVLPNLYYREVAEFHMGMPGVTRERLFELMNTLSNAMVVEDVRAMIAYGEAQSACDTSKVGIVGYCMSGPFVFAAANAFPGQIEAAASIHGVRLFGDAPDSPHLNADKATAELYFGCAEHDEWAPPEMVNGLDAHLKSVGADYKIEWYPETHHGFVFPQREGMYHEPSAERHWEVLFDLFGRKLK